MLPLQKNIPYKHDNKINIRSNSILADMRSDISLLFFMIFINFLKKLSINSIYKSISKKHIGEILSIVRFYIMRSTHKFWKDNLMGEEPGLDGKSRIEIDESKIITLCNKVQWMFGLVDRAKYYICIFFVNDNRQRETLIPIIKDNVYTCYDHLNENKDNNEIIMQIGFILIPFLHIK